MDRDAIERRDFPVGRRGYDQAAVDAHLRSVADELEALRTRSPLAAGASEQVRTIIEAAETSAAELRADAGRRASAHVERVGEAAAAMLARLDELERELATLLEALRGGGERLTEGLARLQEQVARLDDAPAEEDFAAAAPVAADADRPAAPAPGEGEEPDADRPAAAAAGDGDEAGARLIAFNMALDGRPRDETARYLAEHFRAMDIDALLDDVYARAER